MKYLLLTILIIVVILLVSNTRPAKVVLESRDYSDCKYSNYNGSFTFEEMQFQSRDFAMCLRKFQEFKKQNNKDTILYRLCKTSVLKFWRYGDYLSDEKFKLPYMSWQEIEARRGPLLNKSGFQDF
jgi:hypothetical protein